MATTRGMLVMKRHIVGPSEVWYAAASRSKFAEPSCRIILLLLLLLLIIMIMIMIIVIIIINIFLLL